MKNEKSQFIQKFVIAFGMLVVSVVQIAGAFPACVNNKISLSGENGPEIWSCVAPAIDNTMSMAPANSKSLAAPASVDAEIALAKRTTASSDAMNNEIERVLDTVSSQRKTPKQKNLSVGLQYSSNRKAQGLRESRGRTVVVPLSASLNVTDRTRLSVTVPLISKGSELVSSSDVYNSDAMGVGDISINATTQVFNETGRRPGLALSVGLGAPTGKIENPAESDNLSLGSGFWSLSTGATVSKRYDPATVFGSVRYQHVFAEEQFGQKIKPGSSLEFSYGLGFSLNSALSVSGHFAGAIHRNAMVDGREISGSNSEPLEFMASSSLRLSKSARLDSNLGFGLNKDASDARIGLTLTKDF